MAEAARNKRELPEPKGEGEPDAPADKLAPVVSETHTSEKKESIPDDGEAVKVSIKEGDAEKTETEQ